MPPRDPGFWPLKLLGLIGPPSFVVIRLCPLPKEGLSVPPHEFVLREHNQPVVVRRDDHEGHGAAPCVRYRYRGPEIAYASSTTDLFLPSANIALRHAMMFWHVDNNIYIAAFKNSKGEVPYTTVDGKPLRDESTMKLFKGTQIHFGEKEDDGLCTWVVEGIVWGEPAWDCGKWLFWFFLLMGIIVPIVAFDYGISFGIRARI